MKPRKQQQSWKVLKAFKPLRASSADRLDVRIVEDGGSRYVDIRQYLVSATYEGYTQKGVRLTDEQWESLVGQATAISKLLIK